MQGSPFLELAMSGHTAAPPPQLLPDEMPSPRRSNTAPPLSTARIPPKPDLSVTLGCMQYRKVFRQQHGAYMAPRSIKLAILYWTMAFLMMVDNFQIITTDGVTFLGFPAALFSVSPEEEGSWLVIELLVLLGVALVQSQLQHSYGLVFLLPMLQVTVLLMVVALLTELITRLPKGEPGESNYVATLFAYVYLLLSSVGVIYALIARKLGPKMAGSGRFRPVIYRDITNEQDSAAANPGQPSGGEEGGNAFGEFLYWGWNTRKHRCKYSGAVNDVMQPHGYGVWSDSHKDGETLEGYWKNGRPVGPFKSRESAYGSGFNRMQIGYFTCRREGAKSIRCMPKLAPFSVGLASAECCVSGAFFHGHPLVETIWEEHDLKPNTELDRNIFRMLTDMKALHTPQQEPAAVQIFADVHSGIRVSGFTSDSHTATESVTITVPRAPTSVVFDPAGSAETPAGLWPGASLGGIPSRAMEHNAVSPKDSSAAGDTKMARQASIKMGLSHQLIHKNYERMQFQQRLHVNGWSPQLGSVGSEVLIHIHGYNTACEDGLKNVAQLWSFACFPSHIRPIVFSWPTGKLLAYPFAQTKGAENDGVARALRELVVSLARAGVREFHFQTHSMGARVLMHAIPYLEDLFSPTGPDELSQEHKSLELPPSEFLGALKMVTVILMNPEYGMHRFVKTRAKTMDRICGITTVYGDLHDQALQFSYVMNNLQVTLMKHHRATSWMPREVTASQPCRCIWKKRDTCLGLHIYDAQDEEGNDMQVDMIDCTFLQSNVQGGRHNTFTLNRSVIEDIYDVVVNRRPAMQRSNRLEPRGGNVYSFLVAPSHIVAR